MRTMNAALLQPYTTGIRQAGKINTQAFIYNDVFIRTRPNMRLPQVKGSFSQAGSGSRGQSLLSFRDGGDMITFYTPGKGAFAVMTSPLDQKINDISLQPEVFVPLLYNMAIYKSDYRRLAYTIGEDQLVEIDGSVLSSESDFMISGPSEFIPGVSSVGSKMLLDVQGQIKEAGFYDVMHEGELISSFAFNYDRKESDLSLTSEEDLPE